MQGVSIQNSRGTDAGVLHAPSIAEAKMMKAARIASPA